MKKVLHQLKINFIAILSAIIVTVASAITISYLSSFKEKNRNIDRIPTIEKESKQRDSVITADNAMCNKSQQTQIDNLKDTVLTTQKTLDILLQLSAENQTILKLVVKRTKGLESLGEFLNDKNK